MAVLYLYLPANILLIRKLSFPLYQVITERLHKSYGTTSLNITKPSKTLTAIYEVVLEKDPTATAILVDR